MIGYIKKRFFFDFQESLQSYDGNRRYYAYTYICGNNMR